ncbi:MAG TPA: Do family serine endopeptidase [candidate division Zixibacteria bacterium]|nr:Do family serine endopeptidase [candidate division Zixibacteria bacterium]HEQ98871.1 Do family serine endopeptidase [candidate division Zixibacteria bacterium]
MWRSGLRDNNSSHYLRGIIVFFISAVIIIGLGIVSTQFLVPGKASYNWDSGGTSVLPVASTREYPVTEEGESPFVAVVEKTRDAVVNIYAEGENPNARNMDPMWRRFFGLPPRVSSYGSGFVIRPDGYILTNNHVVQGGDKITVTLSDDRTFDAELIGNDPQTDLAVVKIDVRDSLPFIELGNSDDIRVGDWVVAIGNPFPEQGLDRTVTVGVVSAKSRRDLRFGSDTPEYQDYIQTDASINPGNSGGPLVNLRGEAIGINSAIASPNRGSVGIGFAIPSNLARIVASDLIEEGKVSRGWLGVMLSELTQDQREASGVDADAGVRIADVIPGSPADAGGLEPNDIVLDFNGKEVPDLYTFRLMVAEREMGEKVDLKINRDGKEKNISIILGDRDMSLAQSQGQMFPDQDRGDDDPQNTASWLGMSVETATPILARQYEVDYHQGVIVTDVEPGSPAYRKNIVPGTIITKIDFRDVRSKEDFVRISNELQDREKAIAFYIFDLNGNIGYVALKP